jgi:hypothetical protein
MTTTLNKALKMLNKELDRVKQRENATKTDRENLEKAIAQLFADTQGSLPVSATENTDDVDTNNTRFKATPEFLAILEGMADQETWTVSDLMERADKANLRPENMDDSAFKRKLYSQVHIRLGRTIFKESAGYGHNEAQYRNRKKVNRK